MLRATLRIRNYRGPTTAATRGYCATPLKEATINALLMADHVLAGKKPSFPIGDMSKFTTEAAKEKETVRQINSYLQQCAYTKELAKKAAEAAAEKAGAELFAALVAALIVLAKTLSEADKDLDDVEASAKKEREEIEGEIKAAKVDAKQQAELLAELEKEYVTWTDWWNGITEAEKVKCKTAIARAHVAEKHAREQLAVKELQLAAIQAVRAAREKDRDQIVLMVD